MTVFEQGFFVNLERNYASWALVFLVDSHVLLHYLYSLLGLLFEL